EFAVERFVRQPGTKPVGRVQRIAEAREEFLAGPVGTNAVELLGHPPAGEVHRAVPALGQQEWWSLGLVLRRPFDGRAVAADAFLLGRVTAQFAEVFAGAFFDPERLIAPRGAGATVDAADILEHVRLRAGTLHFDRFTVVEIGHGGLRKL